MRLAIAIAVLAAAVCAEEMDYGPYVHFLKSKETAKLRRRASGLVRGLRGLYRVCPKCRGQGRDHGRDPRALLRPRH